MDFSKRVELLNSFVEKRDKEELRKFNEAMEKCRVASKKIEELEPEMAEIIELYTLCRNNNISLPTVKNYLNFSFCPLDFTDSMLLKFSPSPRAKICYSPEGNRHYTYSGNDYEDIGNYDELLDCLGLHTAFLDLFPNFKLIFYKEFDRVIGLEKGF